MSLTIQQAIDTLIAAIPGAPFGETVDTIKIGDPNRPLTKIAVTFLATASVIEQAAQHGAELLITHEPTFYNHLDKTDWLAEHPLYQAKRQLLERSNLVVWRFHDYLHSIQPDPTLVGLLQAFDWQNAEPLAADLPFARHIPTTTLGALKDLVADKLNSKVVRIIGDPNLPCSVAALLPGFPPAEFQIGLLGHPQVDVLITGEIHEWETTEYTRDAELLGFKKGLIITGHAASEEPGMQVVLPWIQERLPGLPITYIPTGSAFVRA